MEGDTRISHIIVETAHSRRHSHIITPGYEVDEKILPHLRFKNYLRREHWVIIAGTLLLGAPRNYYASLCHLAHEAETCICANDMPFAPRRPS